MEIREFAQQVLLSDELDKELISPEKNLTDHTPGPELRVSEPTRPANLQFAAPRTAPAMPKFVSFHQSERRAIAHHIMANHELQALEVMAWTLLAFPDAPTELRIGMVEIMADEQRHTRMHVQRALKLGLNFGDLPVNCYIWKKAMEFSNVMEYLAGLPLVFEGANLDLSLEFANAFEQAGDKRSAALMRVIYNDEIGHVKFGVEWIRKLKPADQSEWDAWNENLHWPLRPIKARGEVFQRDARKAAGMTDDFINKIENYVDDKETDNRN